MKLAELNPTMTGTMGDGVLRFDCPGHPEQRITVPFRKQNPADVGGTRYWHATGSFPDTLTLTPSIDLKASDANGEIHWHGFITRGEVTNA